MHCMNLWSWVASGTTRILFQHTRTTVSSQRFCRLAPEAGNTMFNGGNSNLLSRRGEDISLYISSACVQGNYHSWHPRELKVNLHDLRLLRTISLQNHHLSKWTWEAREGSEIGMNPFQREKNKTKVTAHYCAHSQTTELGLKNMWHIW